jgi:hypothetical protein
MLDAATVPDPVHNQEDGDHRESLHGDSASSITMLEECGHGHSRDHRDLRDIIHARDARSRIKNRHRDREREEQELREERDYDYYGPYYEQPHQKWSPEAGHILEGVKVYSLDLKQVR